MSLPADLPFGFQDLQDVLLGAGVIVRHHYHNQTEAQTKGDGSPLTAADTETNQFLRRRLRELFPAAQWLSEESEDDPARLAAAWVWVVDPLDGTKEFVQRIPELAISVGLVFRESVVLGAVFNPISEEGGIGSLSGRSLFWNLTAVPASESRQELEKASASVSRTEIESGQLVACTNLVGGVKPIGSVAYKLLRVAAGLDDLTFSVQPKSEWDICGGIGLLESVRKIYRRLDGLPCRFNQRDPRIPCGAVAGSEALVNQLHGRLKTALETRI